MTSPDLSKISKIQWALAAVFIILSPAIANCQITETQKFGQSSLGNLLGMIVLIQSGNKISKMLHQGWIWLAAFFYFNTWSQVGITAWLYLAITAWAIYTAIRWKRHGNQILKNDEV